MLIKWASVLLSAVASFIVFCVSAICDVADMLG